jgi:hypothetical protein
MAVQATRSTVITFTGDVDGTETIDAAANTASPGAITIQSLASGFNSVSVPTSTGVTVVAVTIVPPSGNATSIIVKGITGDTGVRVHNTDPTTLSLDSSVTAIGLTVGATIQGVRFYWT